MAGYDTVNVLARDTAGESVVADLDRGLRRAVDDASGYYLLTYRVSWPDDGKFRRRRPGQSTDQAN